MPASAQPHNVLLFVADGLRLALVNTRTAPAIAALRARGVRFANSHSLFPSLRQGQGMHGSFSRADTRNVMAAAGPGFKTTQVDVAPASTADIGMTIARLLTSTFRAKAVWWVVC